MKQLQRIGAQALYIGNGCADCSIAFQSSIAIETPGSNFALQRLYMVYLQGHRFPHDRELTPLQRLTSELGSRRCR